MNNIFVEPNYNELKPPVVKLKPLVVKLNYNSIIKSKPIPIPKSKYVSIPIIKSKTLPQLFKKYYNI